MDNFILSRSIGLLMLLCLTVALGQEAKGQVGYVDGVSTRCAPCADGVCRTRSRTFGYTPQQWNRWPEDASGPNAGPVDNNRQPIEVPTHLPPSPSDETLPSPPRPSLQRPVDVPYDLPPATPDNGVDAPPVDFESTPPPAEPPRPNEDLILPGFDDQGKIHSIPAVQTATFYITDRMITAGEEINVVYEVSEDYSVTNENQTDLLAPPATFDPSSLDTVTDRPTTGRRNPLR